MPGNWITVTESRYPHEREALDFVRERLPDRDPYRAWSNFEFLADDGSVNEVDLLVLTPLGIFLVEIKSRPGILTGDAGTWTWQHEARLITDDNPVIAANRKCKKLRSLLERQKAIKKLKGRLPLREAQRAFEIVLARKMARGELQTTWFERHGSTPITELPADWPEDYRKLVERRIEVIETNPQIALIKQPQCKRRWNSEPWDSQVERALRGWLLDRLEAYFDFDGRMNDDGKPTAKVSIGLLSVARLADLARADAQFMEAAEVYRDRPDFDVASLVAELVEAESVPLLPILRYKSSGLDKRDAWERTWELQRQEDAIDGRIGKEGPDGLTEDQARRLKQERIGDIPKPPTFTKNDFQNANYWRLRGKLDVPKERWASFPLCEGEDQSLVIAWAGYDHLQLAQAIAKYFADVEQRGGSDDPRLVPLLACLQELVPWLKQWHNEVDPTYGYRLGDYFESFVDDEARNLPREGGRTGWTVEEIKAWQPPRKAGRRRKNSASP